MKSKYVIGGYRQRFKQSRTKINTGLYSPLQDKYFINVPGVYKCSLTKRGFAKNIAEVTLHEHLHGMFWTDFFDEVGGYKGRGEEKVVDIMTGARPLSRWKAFKKRMFTLATRSILAGLLIGLVFSIC